jgi:hypothetical protein
VRQQHQSLRCSTKVCQRLGNYVEGYHKNIHFYGQRAERILPVPMMVNLGMGKSASAYWLGVADSLYSAREYR